MKHLLITILLALIVGCTGIESDPVTVPVTIVFTHTGDDGIVGLASLIEWKWATDTLKSWDQWTMITDTITPQIPLTLDTAYFEIVFPDNGIYWIGLNTADEPQAHLNGGRNWSGICVKATIYLPDNIAPACIVSDIIEVLIQ